MVWKARMGAKRMFERSMRAVRVETHLDLLLLRHGGEIDADGERAGQVPRDGVPEDDEAVLGRPRR